MTLFSGSKSIIMKLLSFSAIAFLSSFLTTLYAQQSIPFSDKRWVIQAQGSLQEPYRGNNSLYLQNGIAFLKDEQFGNGIIEFDIFQTPRPSFSGLIFRVKDSDNYEELYFRSHQSGNPDAYQYTPVFNGDAAWQLYHDAHDGVNDGFEHWKPRGKLMGYNTMVEYPFDRWLHIKLLVKGSQAELYVDNNATPAAFIRELLTGQASGSLGVRSGAGAVWFANFSFTANNDIEFKTKDDGYRITTPPGTITSWQVSSAFKEDQVNKMNQLDNKWLGQLKWKNLPAEASGLANLSRLSAVSDSTSTALAKITVVSDKEQIKRLDIGYSDRIKIYCNGNAIYSGNTSFRTRDYRYLGTIGYFDAVYLPLKKGENTIIMAVSENFGGWGVMAKWENMESLRTP
jgi:hypothetical protein